MLNNFIGPDEDVNLAVSVNQGNQQSFGKLYDKYAPALFGIISRIVNDKKLAEEILNAAFVNTWNQVATFNASKTSLFTWLISIARQTALDEIKSEQFKNPLYSNPVYEENKKSAFDLVYYKGLNCIEAAAQLNITVEELKADIKMTIKNMKEKEVVC